MEDVEIITLEDNNDYIVTKEIVVDNVKFVFLTKTDDVASFLKALKGFTEEVKSS